MKPANYSPVYCAMYPDLAEITREHGYALAIHGSMARDFDLICIPWREDVSDPETVVNAITKRYAVKRVGGPPTQKVHGRLAYTISVAWGECAIDLSFMPLSTGYDVGAFTKRGIELAAEWVDQRLFKFEWNNGDHDEATGVCTFKGPDAATNRQYVKELSEVAEGIRGIKAKDGEYPKPPAIPINPETYVSCTGTSIKTPPKLRAFYEEFHALCQKHGISISHEDSHGGFELEPYNEESQLWISGAGIDPKLAEQLKDADDAA